jgi:hypothetical protein
MILHTHEDTQWSKVTVMKIPSKRCITKNIWVIDSEDYQTMMLPEDY